MISHLVHPNLLLVEEHTLMISEINLALSALKSAVNWNRNVRIVRWCFVDTFSYHLYRSNIVTNYIYAFKNYYCFINVKLNMAEQ